MKLLPLLALTTVLISASVCQAQRVQVTGGRSDATLDATQLVVAGLVIDRFSPDVVNPSPAGGIGFNINGRNHATRPTTFVYEANALFPVTGTVEHSGSVFFNSTNPVGGVGEVEIGDFSIGYDMARVSATNSGFFVRSTVGLQGILFDLAGGSGGTFPADETQIRVNTSLLVSPELATRLGNDLFIGAAVGSFSINGNAVAVPEPSSMGIMWMIGSVSNGIKKL